MVMRRTTDHLHRLGGAVVSSKPIVMRAEYAFCPNLTIVDTPGFILKVDLHFVCWQCTRPSTLNY